MEQKSPQQPAQQTATAGEVPLPEFGSPASDSVEKIAETIKKQEESMPPDLRADVLLDHHKILNWSSPDQEPDQKELPLTGEQTL